MSVSDVILAFERAVFGAEAWKSVVSDENSVCVTDDYGYALGARCGGEFELYRIGVLPQMRRRGYGTALLTRFHGLCRDLYKECGGTAVFLEADEDNAAAVALYRRAGYAVVSRRRGYYGGSDALIMRRELR